MTKQRAEGAEQSAAMPQSPVLTVSCGAQWEPPRNAALPVPELPAVLWETQGTPMYALKTPTAEVALALLIVMRRGSLRAAEETTGHKYETISVWLKRAAAHAEALTQVLASDLHLSQVEIAEFWVFVQKKRAQLPSRTKESAGAAWSKTATVASSLQVLPAP